MINREREKIKYHFHYLPRRKAIVDFLFLDDGKTLVDDEVTLGKKALAGLFLTPFGKLGKDVKLVKNTIILK